MTEKMFKSGSKSNGWFLKLY